MTNYPKISIVIPSFNKVKYIEETLKSIVDQDYKNLEVIIRDGGSTDGTLKIIRNYVKKYPNIFSCISKKDKGQTDALNKGFKKANGEIFAFINADDIYERNAFVTVAEVYSRHPDSLWLIGQGKVMVEKNLLIAKLVTYYKNIFLKINSYLGLLIFNYVMQPSVFITRKTYEKFGPFEGSGRILMEYKLWLKIGKIKMPHVINRYLSSFRLPHDGFSRKNTDEILKNDLVIVREYTSNLLIIFVHKIHNLGRKLLRYQS